MGRVNALDKLEKAAAWCTLQGADGVADLKGYEDEFVAALSLPRIKHEKLLYMLKNKYIEVMVQKGFMTMFKGF